MAFGSLQCSGDDGSARVVLRADSASSWLLFGRCLSPLFSLACIVVEFSMCRWVRPSDIVCFPSIGDQSRTLFSHKGAKCFSSLSEYLSDWRWFRSCLA